MSISNIQDINPLDWHGTKLLSYIPAHFVQVKFRHNTSRLEVLTWIEQNTVGRYAIQESVKTEPGARWLVNEDFRIGFENPAEATMYTMFFR